MRMHSLALVALLAGVTSAQADTISQWNFNSTAADANPATGTLLTNVGSGAVSLVGGTTGTFASGDASGGSSDPATSDDSGWNTTTYAAQSAGDKTRGVQFSISTVGFENLSFSYDLRHSNTSSRYELVQYSLDGGTFLDLATFDAASGGDVWYNGRTVNLGGIAGAADNANFALRVVATYAPGTSSYVATTTGSNYAAAGTWRFDMATLSGTQIAAVPEPDALLLVACGLGVMGSVARRRRVR